MAESNKSFVVKSPNGISFEFSPWTDKAKFQITSIHIKEELGGEIAGGTVELRYNATDEEALRYITEQNTGIIRVVDEKENGLSYEIPVCIHKRNHLIDTIHLDVLCIPSIEFITKKNSVSFDDIDSAIEKLYPGNRDIRTKPDSGVSNMPEIQRCRSDYDFCSYLCKSYKKDSIFCFGWEGLMIKDRIGKNSFGNDEPDEKMKLLNGTGIVISSSQRMTYNTDLTEERKPFFPFTDTELSLTKTDYSEVEPKYVTTMMYADEYHIIGKEYMAHVENWKHNSKQLSTDLYYALKARSVDIPFYKIGDIVMLNRFAEVEGDAESSNPYKNYLVKSNEIFYSNEKSNKVDSYGSKFSWTSLFIGLDKGEWNEIKKES